MAVAIASPNTKLFYRAVSGLLRGWQALRIAVDAGFGGSWGNEKACWLEEVTALFLCENENVESWELEERLALLMNQEFDTIVEDGSLTEISRKICELYQQCCQGKCKQVEDFIACCRPAEGTSVQFLQQESIGEEEVEETVQQIADLSLESTDQQGPSLADTGRNDEEKPGPKEPGTDGESAEEGWEVVRRGRRRKSK